MVDSDSITEADGFAGDHRPSLQTYQWKHERNHRHDQGSNEQAEKFITRRIFCSSTSHSLLDSDIR